LFRPLPASAGQTAAALARLALATATAACTEPWNC
jgi:hypothetical protein